MNPVERLAAEIALRVMEHAPVRKGDYDRESHDGCDACADIRAGRVIPIDGPEPTKAHPDDAAYDLRCAEDTRTLIWPGQRDYIGCGFAMAIPEGHVGLVCSRGGLALKHGVFVLNAPGVIDPGYRGSIGVVLMNLGTDIAVIERGDRIAQLLIVPTSSFTFVQESALEPTQRGAAGFGSTGMA